MAASAEVRTAERKNCRCRLSSGRKPIARPGLQLASLLHALSVAERPVISNRLPATTMLRTTVICWVFWTAAACYDEMDHLQPM